MTAVCVRDLGKRYGDLVALREVSFEVTHGEIVGLLGPNGAGKTSTLECLLGLRTPDSGTIAIEGHDAVAHPAHVQGRIGAVLQTTALQDAITPREALRLFASLHGQPRTRADALLDEFSLRDKAREPFATLSGGQRQRLALALAFIPTPRVLVLDEPTAGLDPAARRDLHERIRRRRDEGCAVLLSTHDMAEAQHLCDRIVIIDGGRIIAMGTPDELLARAGAPARIRLRARPAPTPADLAALAGARACTAVDDALVIHTIDCGDTLAALARHLAQHGHAILEMHVTAPSLEDAFLHLTGKSFGPEATKR
ncbi:MAG: ABC transporter ATP-binding protein [Opitutaceae bacterium]|nr:ABC transporter ATP-binding protein [Opitutaceae bacterium]